MGSRQANLAKCTNCACDHDGPSLVESVSDLDNNQDDEPQSTATIDSEPRSQDDRDEERNALVRSLVLIRLRSYWQSAISMPEHSNIVKSVSDLEEKRSECTGIIQFAWSQKVQGPANFSSTGGSGQSLLMHVNWERSSSSKQLKIAKVTAASRDTGCGKGSSYYKGIFWLILSLSFTVGTSSEIIQNMPREQPSVAVMTDEPSDYGPFFTSTPSNVSCYVGKNAIFNCEVKPSTYAPIWAINGKLYPSSLLPLHHEYVGYGLLVKSVDCSMDGNTYRCLINSNQKSEEVHLIVLPKVAESTVHNDFIKIKQSHKVVFFVSTLMYVLIP